MLKREVRILGLSASRAIGNSIPVIGVVFRGNLWLDGIITCALKTGQPNYLSVLARTIRRCKQYSQLRAIIVSREELLPRHHLDMAKLSDATKLPIITMTNAKLSRTTDKVTRRRWIKGSGVNRYQIKLFQKRIQVLAAGLDHNQAAELFSVSCARGRVIPEAVRVAELVARHFLLHDPNRNQVTLKLNPPGFA